MIDGIDRVGRRHGKRESEKIIFPVELTTSKIVDLINTLLNVLTGVTHLAPSPSETWCWGMGVGGHFRLV